jgi:hypothetical protein
MAFTQQALTAFFTKSASVVTSNVSAPNSPESTRMDEEDIVVSSDEDIENIVAASSDEADEPPPANEQGNKRKRSAAVSAGKSNAKSTLFKVFWLYIYIYSKNIS